MMEYYPVYLDIKGRPCLVVGGGGVGTRKATSLIAAGALVTVVSPKITDRLETLAQAGAIKWRRGVYQSGDLEGMFMVFGATNDDILNRKIHADAELHRVLCNIADRPAICHFILPSVVRRGDLSIAISTAGKSPAFAKKLRKELEKQFGPEYDVFLQLMGQIREKLLSEAHEPEAHKHLFEQLINGGLLRLLKNENFAEADALLEKVVGHGFKIEKLIKGA